MKIIKNQKNAWQRRHSFFFTPKMENPNWIEMPEFGLFHLFYNKIIKTCYKIKCDISCHRTFWSIMLWRRPFDDIKHLNLQFYDYIQKLPFAGCRDFHSFFVSNEHLSTSKPHKCVYELALSLCLFYSYVFIALWRVKQKKQFMNRKLHHT